MVYEKQTWVNGVGGGTPISAARLSHIEDGVEELSIETTSGRLSASGLSATIEAEVAAKAVTKNGVALASWFQALLTGDAVWVGIGDSTMEGSGRAAVADRWPNLISADLRTALGVTGADYVPGFSSTSVPDLWTTSSGSVTESGTTVAAVGLGSKALIIPVGEYAEHTFDGAGFRLFYYSGANTGAMEISIDGGAATEVVTTGTPGSNVWDSPTLTDDTHTIRVTTKAATNTNYLQGGIATNGVGVSYYDAAHAGISAQTIASATQALDQLSNIGPDLVMVDLGINDFRDGRTAAEFRADLTTILDKIKAEAATAILLVLPHEPDAPSAVATWAEYADVVRDLAANDVGVALFDVYALGDDLAYNHDPNGYLSDEGAPGSAGNLHLSPAGEDFYRDEFLTYFGPGQSPQSLASIAAVGPTAKAYLLALANTWAAKQTLTSGADINGTVLLNALLDLRTASGQVWLGNNRKIRGTQADGTTLVDLAYVAAGGKATYGVSTVGTSILGSTVGFLGAAGSARRGATADATDLATAITLVNALKADLIAYGLKTA